MRSIYYDLETTGLGKVGREPFKRPVGIFNLAYAGTGGGISSLYGISKVPFEDNDFIRKLKRINSEGIKAAKSAGRSEEDILRKFVGSLEEGDTLIGWNSLEFDSPMLVKRLQDVGLVDEAAKVSRMKHVDLMKKVKGYMDRMIGEIPGAEDSPWAFGAKGKPRGMSQSAIATGLGIQIGEAHVGKEDVRVLEEIARHSADYKTFKKRMTDNDGLRMWAKFTDAGRESINETKYSDAFVGKTGGIPSESTARLITETNDSSYYTRAGSELKKFDWSKAQEGADDISKVAASSAKREAGKFEKGFEKYFGGLNDADIVKSAKIGGAILAGAYAINKVREFTRDKGEEVPQDLRINARELGKPAYEIVNDLKRAKSIKNLNKEIKAEYHTMKAGTIIGKQVEEEMSRMDGFIGAEYELEDRHLGVKGFADTVMEIDGEKRAIELKTVDDDEFDRLRGPKAAHAMQANFYTHALGAKMGHVMYISRQNPEKRVTFDVPYDPGSLIAAVEKYRGAVYTAAQSGGYKTALEYFFGNKSGTRDQTSRNYFTGPGYMKTPNPPNNSYVGSRNIQRNN